MNNPLTDLQQIQKDLELLQIRIESLQQTAISIQKSRPVASISLAFVDLHSQLVITLDQSDIPFNLIWEIQQLIDRSIDEWQRQAASLSFISSTD